VPTAIDISSVVGLTALGMFTAQILIGLLLSVGYNPIRQWPRQRWIKLFTLHNWLGYIGLATAATHALTLLFATVKGGTGFRLFDILVPIWSPVQPLPNTLGAIAFYLVTFVVLTSYFRRVFGRHRWKQLHYVAYAAAAVFYFHGVAADPLLENHPPDYIDAEKVYVEACALLVTGATVARFRARTGRS
jgi:predicted ferric reductase